MSVRFDPPDAALLHLMDRLQNASGLAGTAILAEPPQPGEEGSTLYVYRYSGTPPSQTVGGAEGASVELWCVAALVAPGADANPALGRLDVAHVALQRSSGRNASGCVLSCFREWTRTAPDTDVRTGRVWTRLYRAYRLEIGP